MDVIYEPLMILPPWAVVTTWVSVGVGAVYATAVWVQARMRERGATPG